MYMAKKNEFKPDKPQSGVLSKLYLTRKQRQSILKWLLYSLVLLVLSVLQDVILCRMRFFGATTDLVPVGIFLICLLTGLQDGCIFLLITACLYQFSGTAPAPYCIAVIVVLGIFVTYFRQSFLQKRFSSAMVCVVFALLIYEAAVFTVSLLQGLTVLGGIRTTLLTVLLSSCVAPLLYPLIKAIGTIGGEPWKE